jgi:hypothetical protein
MDPTNPGEKPGDPTRPSWGSPQTPSESGGGNPPEAPYGAPASPYGSQPSSPYAAPMPSPYGQPTPDQPGYAAPPAFPYGAQPTPDQPGYGVPPAFPYGAQPTPDQPGYGVPPAFPYGAPPAWGVAAPTSKPTMLPRIVGAVVAIVVVVIAGAFLYGVFSGGSDKIVFSTDQPVAGTSTGCTINDQVTSVRSTTSVYVSYIFGSTQGSDVLSVAITKDGQSFLPPTVIPDTQGYDCFSDTTDLSQLPGWGPGTYHFVVTSSDGKTQATGDLTVK